MVLPWTRSNLWKPQVPWNERGRKPKIGRNKIINVKRLYNHWLQVSLLEIDSLTGLEWKIQILIVTKRFILKICINFHSEKLKWQYIYILKKNTIIQNSQWVTNKFLFMYFVCTEIEMRKTSCQEILQIWLKDRSIIQEFLNLF